MYGWWEGPEGKWEVVCLLLLLTDSHGVSLKETLMSVSDLWPGNHMHLQQGLLGIVNVFKTLAMCGCVRVRAYVYVSV